MVSNKSSERSSTLSLSSTLTTAEKRAMVILEAIDEIVLQTTSDQFRSSNFLMNEQLKLHFSNSKTCDLVYEKIMERTRQWRKTISSEMNQLKEEFIQLRSNSFHPGKETKVEIVIPDSPRISELNSINWSEVVPAKPNQIGEGYIDNVTGIDGENGLVLYLNFLEKILSLLRISIPDFTPSPSILLALFPFLNEIQGDVNLSLHKFPKGEETKTSLRFIRAILAKMLQSIGQKDLQKQLLLTSHISASKIDLFSSMRHSNSQEKVNPNYRSLSHSHSQSSSSTPVPNSTDSSMKNISTPMSKGSLSRKNRGSFSEAKYATKNFLTIRKSYRKLPKRNNSYRFGDSLLFGGHLKAAGEVPPKILNSFSRPISGDFKAETIKDYIKSEENHSESKPAQADNSIKWIDNNPKFHTNVEVTRKLKKASEAGVKMDGKEVGGNGNNLKQEPITPSKDPNQRTEKWMDNLIKSVIAVEKTESDIEHRQNASKTLVRLLVDEFFLEETSPQHQNNSGNSTETNDQILTTLFIEILLSKEEESRIHAFDLLYNLQLHVDNLIEKSLNLVEIQKMATLDRQQAKKIAALGSNRNLFASRLYFILQDLISFLSFKEESSESVWTAAFKVLVFFLSEKSRLKKSKLAELDVKIIWAFLNKMGTKLDVESERLLVRMLTNCLYIPSKMLDLKVFSVVCNSSVTSEINPIDSIISRYVAAKSGEERENLFVILYDFIIQSVGTSNKKFQEIVQRASSDNHAIWLLEVLKALNAPLHFMDIFVVTPKNFGERMWNTLTGIWPSFAAKVDKQFALLVLQEGFEKLATSYTSLPDEIEAHLNANNLGENRSEILNALLHSTFPANRRNGERWLSELILNHMEDATTGWLSGHNNSLLDPVNKVFLGLCQSSDYHNRKTYLNVTQRLLISLRYKMTTWGEEAIVNKMGSLINENLMRLIKAGEKNQSVLKQSSDLLFYFVSNPLDENGPSEESEVDTIWANFLNGSMEVSKSALKFISITVLHYLLNWLPECNDTNNIRVVLLHLVIFKLSGASKDVFDSIGGIRFMEKLTASIDPTLSYIAGRFIIEQLEKEDPEQYMKLLKGLLMTAQEQEDGDLIVHNEYWQIKTLKTILDKKIKSES